MKIAIIGAGPAGLALANELTKNNCEVDIYDTAPEAGGFSKSIELFNRKIEIGPHFFNVGKLPAVKKMVLETLNGNYHNYQRKTFILIDDKIFSYPPSVSDMLKKLTIPQLITALASLLKQSITPEKPDGTAETFVTKHLGAFLYRYFFQNFAQKLWGVTGRQLSDVFAKSLIGFNQGFSPARVVYEKLKQGFTQAEEGDMHIYPNNGFSTLWNALKGKIEVQGGTFYFSTQIKSLDCSTQPGEITHLTLKDGTIREYDSFISTIPVSSLLSFLAPGLNVTSHPEKTIRYRSDILLYLNVSYDRALAGQCFYIYSKDISVTRITNFDAFTAEEHDSHIILVEFWCGKTDAIWQAEKDDLVKIALAEIKKTTFFTNLKVLDSTVKKVENAFQIPDLDFPENRDYLFKQVSAYANLHITGRTAAINFNYGMENAMDDGIKLANELLKHAQEIYDLEKI